MKQHLDIYVDASLHANKTSACGIGLIASANHVVVEMNTFLKPYSHIKVQTVESMGIEHAIRCVMKHIGEYKKFTIHNDNQSSVSRWKQLLRQDGGKKSANQLLGYLPDAALIHQARLLVELGTLQITHSGRASCCESRLADRLATDAYIAPKSARSTSDAFATIMRQGKHRSKHVPSSNMIKQVLETAKITRERQRQRKAAVKENNKSAVVYHPGFFAEVAFDRQVAAYFN